MSFEEDLLTVNRIFKQISKDFTFRYIKSDDYFLYLCIRKLHFSLIAAGLGSFLFQRLLGISNALELLCTRLVQPNLPFQEFLANKKDSVYLKKLRLNSIIYVLYSRMSAEKAAALPMAILIICCAIAAKMIDCTSEVPASCLFAILNVYLGEELAKECGYDVEIAILDDLDWVVMPLFSEEDQAKIDQICKWYSKSLYNMYCRTLILKLCFSYTGFEAYHSAISKIQDVLSPQSSPQLSESSHCQATVKLLENQCSVKSVSTVQTSRPVSVGIQKIPPIAQPGKAVFLVKKALSSDIQKMFLKEVQNRK